MNFKPWFFKQLRDLSPIGIVLGMFVTITSAAFVAFLIVTAFHYPQTLIGYFAALIGWIYIQYKRDTKNDI